MAHCHSVLLLCITQKTEQGPLYSLSTFDKGKKAKTVFETKTAHSHAVL